MPTQTTENYLKALFAISQKSDTVTITELAEVMQVSKPTANSMVKKMEENGWVNYEKYKPLRLTDKGATLAALIVRKHRLAEMFLVEVMNFGWEEVHAIAEEMEHIQSPKIFDRMDEILGFPTLDPHGSPIPDKEGKFSASTYLNLSTRDKGEKLKLCGLTDSSEELLVYLNKKNIQLGTELTIVRIENFDKSIELLVNNDATIFLTNEVVKCLLVEKI